MSVRPTHNKTRSALLGAMAAIVWIGALGCKPSPQAVAAPKPKPPPLTASPTNSAPVDTSEFVSVFDDLLPQDKAKDPFFPNSTRRFPKAAPVPGPTPVPVPVEPTLTLKGISGGRHPSAIINNAELQVGEEQAVRTSTGRVAVKVLEIGDDFVKVQVKGETKTLMLEHKK